MSLPRRCVSLATALAALAVLSGCAAATPAVGYFLLITNSWQDVTRADHTFQLVSSDDNQTEGSFTGQEFVNANDFTGFNLSGSWKDNEIQFTVQRSGGSVRYTGSIGSDRPTELSFTSSAGSLRIRRGQ
jgi:hypothetical protein